MAYTALYRRLRPRNFRDVIGQQHIIRTLLNEMKTDTLSHAYLFCGTRGTGKTSTAKIFAKAVNCLDLQEGEPCGKCELCTAADNGSSMNVIELDAASNNGVEDVRRIRDEVKYTPAVGKYKVYIIDEVHMLSQSAFNALLKTLEEPPSHVIFILATTDPQKIPVTILSRCQRFDFKRITSKDISHSLREFAQSENINITDDALFYIANICEGAMRDALTILDRCIAYYYNEEITLEKVLDVCGSVDNDVFFRLTDALIDYNSAECIRILNDIYDRGRDIVQFSAELVTHFRNELVASQIENDNTFSENDYNRYREQAERTKTEILIKYITSFAELNAVLKLEKNPKTLVEVQCIRLCNAFDKSDIEGIYNKIGLLEKEIAKGINVVPSNKAVNMPEPKETVKKNEKHKIITEEVREIQDKWEPFVDILEDGKLKSILKYAFPDVAEDKSKFYVICKHSMQQVINEDDKEIIANRIIDFYGKNYEVEIITDENYNKKSYISNKSESEFKDVESEVNFQINYK